jgi:hypothetical protein
LHNSFKNNQIINFGKLKYIRQHDKKYIRSNQPEDINHLKEIYLQIVTFKPTEQIDTNSINYTSLTKIAEKLSSEKDELIKFQEKHLDPNNNKSLKNLLEFMDYMIENLNEIHTTLYVDFAPLYYKFNLADRNLNGLTKYIYDNNPQFIGTPIIDIQQNYQYKDLYNKFLTEQKLQLEIFNASYNELNKKFITLTTLNLNNFNRYEYFLIRKLK